MPANEISRASQYLSKMMYEFERMTNILQYRTPLSLRSYSQVFLNTFPVIFGPYFAQIAVEYYPAVGYLVSATYALVLVSLDNIQDTLEDPFDMVGADDVRLEVTSRYRALLASTGHSPVPADKP